jgi:hypothetical protein
VFIINVVEVGSNLFIWSLRGRRPAPAAEGTKGDAVPIIFNHRLGMINYKQNEVGQIYIASSRRDDRTAHTVEESWTIQMVVHGLRNGMNFQSSLLPSSVRWSSSRAILPRVRLRNIFQVPNHGVCSCITSA